MGIRQIALAEAAIAVLMGSISLSAEARADKINGVCGPANGVPISSAPTSGLCNAGTPTAVTGSGPWTWQCKGSHGGSTASCSAPLAHPPPALTLTFSPAAPSMQETAPLGSQVATIIAAWSDGSPFSGTLSFASPYLDDGGTFGMSGSNLIVSPAGAGLNGDGGTIQNVTVSATQ
jgi:hypothetical protein